MSRLLVRDKNLLEVMMKEDTPAVGKENLTRRKWRKLGAEVYLERESP